MDYSERARKRASSVICALVGFAGVIVAMQGAPQAKPNRRNTISASSPFLVSAGFFSIAMVLLRERAQKDGAPIVGLMTSVVPGMILAAPTIAFATLPADPDRLAVLFANWARSPPYLCI